MNYKQLVKEQLSDKRFHHSLRVADTAITLARAHHCETVHAEIAGLLHDYCKEYPKTDLVRLAVEGNLLASREDLLMPQVLHGPVAAYVLKTKGIVIDKDILEAIHFHTTGHPDMGELAKIIFVADYIEPGRKTPNIDKLFEIALQDLDQCIVRIVDDTLSYLVSGQKIIHEDMIKLRNKLLARSMCLI